MTENTSTSPLIDVLGTYIPVLSRGCRKSASTQLHLDDLRRAIPGCRFFKTTQVRDRVGFYDLGVVSVLAESVVHGVNIGSERVGGNLYAVFESRREIGHKGFGVIGVAFSDDERWSQFHFDIQADERPDIAIMKAGIADHVWTLDEIAGLLGCQRPLSDV